MVTIIGKGHWRYMDEPRRLEAPGRIIEQPANRGTTAGVLLPLAFVLKQDPEAVAVLLPSDHFIAQPFRFQRHLRRALRRAEEEPGRIFLLAARPDAPEPDYGWLRLRPNASGVDEFLEKPDRETALRLYAEGCLWNTMVVAAKASTLWDLGRRHCPGIVSLLESARAWLGSPWESEALREVYSKMPESNFSKAILERVPERIGAVVMNDVGWSDWGRPERIIETLEGLRLEANFPKPGRLSPQFA
jgi:mannose-1-phosphate guanylyltransferase